MANYQCKVCGYIYKSEKGDPPDIKPGTSFTDLPEDWVCPVCKVGKEQFSKIEPEVTKNPVIRHYSNGEITVIWKPALCNHNGNCWKSLKKVFDPERRPWVDINAAESATIVKVVDQCPTKALTWEPAKKE
jgi:rubredoxin/uncharacterized Fe-S cluster protein YjdI